MATLTSKSVSHDRLLHVAVGAGQIVLATFFAAMASLKLLMREERLVEIMAWTETLPLPLVRGLGVLELIGAIAVAIPAVTRAPQRIVGIAALSFLTLMASASIIHIARGELRMVAVNIAVGALAAFVAWGRLTHEPIESSGRY
jgi:apolipoprotein N-acyltransferase